jgi:tetratricopeptide (TPR) repeat protein
MAAFLYNAVINFYQTKLKEAKKFMKKANNIKTFKVIDIVIISIICILAVLLVFLPAGCKKKPAAATESTAAATTAAQAETTTAAQTESATESVEEVPEEITGLIEQADAYYEEGDIGLARSTYRKAEIAVNNSKLSNEKKQELTSSFYPRYEECKDIIASASMHYASAMQLIYETRYEEAKTELETALAQYPKYEEAQEAYDNLKTLMGLQ